LDILSNLAFFFIDWPFGQTISSQSVNSSTTLIGVFCGLLRTEAQGPKPMEIVNAEVEFKKS
jgi:hypothetical protein